MRRQDFLSLQNGSDIRGVAMGEGAILTPFSICGIGEAFGRQLIQSGKGRPVVAVGHDSRLTGPAFADALADGLESAGCVPFLTGLSTTPSMFMTCIDARVGADAAAMVTASHLPGERNGVKFFTADGGCGKHVVRAVLENAREIPLRHGAHARRPVLPAYAASLCAHVRAWTGCARPLEGLHVLIDAGGGAGGFYAHDVLEALGAETSGSLYLAPDGAFSGHEPNPEKEENLKELAAAVVERGADLGIAFDTDADRAALIDKTGARISRNRLIALAAAVLAPAHPGGTVVTDSVTSAGLTHFLIQKGLVHRRFKRGYQNVIDEARRLCELGVDVPLAIETSGHAALRENRFLDDGMYLATRLLAALVQCRARGVELADLIAELKEPQESVEYRIPLKKEGFAQAGQTILERLSRFVEGHPALRPATDNHEGLRVDVVPRGGDGWFLLRLSLHDPVLALNLESEQQGGVRRMEALLTPFFEGVAPLLEKGPDWMSRP